MAFVNMALTACLIAGASPLSAQDDGVPYWASIRTDEVNMRVGPATTYRIEWVYKRNGLPIKVLRKKEGWRLVEDPDGVQGWMLSRFLSRKRAALVIGDDPADMRQKGDRAATLLWRVEPGVSGDLGECGAGWCEFAVGGHSGFIAQDRVWGAGEP